MSNVSDVQATVVAGSLAVFLPGVSAADREDILLGNLFAQVTAREEYAEGLVPDWFANYRRKLSFLGWDAAPPPGVALPGPDRVGVKLNALAQIKQYGSAALAAATGNALDALAREPQALDLFDVSMRHGTQAHLQFMPCVRHSGDYFDMVLYHMETVLGREWNARTLLYNPVNVHIDYSKSRLQLVRFNLRLFRDQHKQRVQARLQGKATHFLRNLNLTAPGSP